MHLLHRRAGAGGMYCLTRQLDADLEPTLQVFPSPQDFLEHGLGFGAVAARLLRQCLGDGLTPRWSASNPVSQRLAVRLGYRPAGVCEVLYRR